MRFTNSLQLSLACVIITVASHTPESTEGKADGHLALSPANGHRAG